MHTHIYTEKEGRGQTEGKRREEECRGRRGGGESCSGVLNRRTTALVIRIDGFSRFLNSRLLATSRAGDNEARQTDKLRHGCTRRCTGRR